MKHNIIAAAVLGFCLVVAAIIHSGRYDFIGSDCSIARGDRWTGKVRIIANPDGSKDCPEGPFGWVGR